MAVVLGHTEARNTLLVVASTAFVLAGGVPLAHTVTPDLDMGQGIAGLVLVIAAIIVLLTAPRATRTYLGRILPRLTALALLCALLVGDWTKALKGVDWFFPLVPLCVLIAISVVTVVMTSIVETTNNAALIGTILDFVQSFCTFALLPAAVMASGLFSFAWRAVL